MIDFVVDPLSVWIVYVPETSQPEPPDITSVEYLPLFFTEICSAHTRSLFGFLIDKFTSLELEDTPLMDIRSFWPYEDKSVWTDNCNLISDFISSSENELVLSENEINAAIIITEAIPPNPKINFGLFKRKFDFV